MSTQGGTRLRIHFVDSSDEGASHQAEMQLGSPNDDAASVEDASRVAGSSGMSGQQHQPYGSAVPNSAAAEGRERARPGWFSSTLYGVASSAAALFLGRSEEPHSPFAPTQATLPGSDQRLLLTGPPREEVDRRSRGSSGGGWEFGSSARRTSATGTSDSPYAPASEGSLGQPGGEDDQVSLDLRDTVLLFLQTGSDVFMNVILATLKSSNELVDGETFEIASANPTLLRVFLDSGRVDVEDPRVQALVQGKLDELLAGDPYVGDVVPGELLDYVRCLCNVKTSRITFQQMVLIRYSGFDYIELLIDYPYLLSDMKRPGLCVRIVFSVLHYLSICLSWLGVLVALMFAAMVIWTVVFWFQHPENRNNGYWTIITYVGGYVVSLVVTMRAEEGKIAHYDNEQWEYPNNNLRIIPLYPHYEVMLSYVSLRYEISADAKHFYIIRYDLRNGVLIQEICNGFFFAMPQLVLQSFLFGGEWNSTSYLGAVVYWLLLWASCALMFMSVFAYYRIGVFCHSCNSQGFAILSTQGNNTGGTHLAKALGRRAKPTDIATKALLFFLFYYLIAEAVTLFILLLNLTGCNAGPVIFLAIWVPVVGLSIIVLVLTQVYLSLSRGLGAIAFPPLIMKIAYLVYLKYEDSNPTCMMFRYQYTGWTIPSLAAFGVTCLSLLGCVAVFIVEHVRGSQITQSAVDKYLFA